MKFDVLTIFPDIFASYINKGMIRIARERKIIKIKTHNLRDFAVDKRGTVDDRPFGGGPGQILMVEPVYRALQTLRRRGRQGRDALQCVSTCASAGSMRSARTKIVLLSAKGKTWNQDMAKKFAKVDQVIFVCPRYEGHDERIRKFVDEEISIGDYVLTGGELGAMVIIDSITRLIPGVLGEPASLTEESHSLPGYLEYPQYTRPEVFEYKSKTSKTSKTSETSKTSKTSETPKQILRIAPGQASKTSETSETSETSKKKITRMRVPAVLLSGHHKKIAEWRGENAKRK